MTPTETAYVKSLEDQVSSLKEQLGWLNRQVFGKRSEKLINLSNPEQPLLTGFEDLEQPKPEKPKRKVSAHERKAPDRDGKNSLTIPEDIPVERTILDVPDDQKICAITGQALVKIGEDISRKLAHRAGSFFVKEIVRPKYAHPDREESGVLSADLPSSIFPKCRADESLLAEVITRKFADHLPLYRLSEIFSRDGVQITRQVLSGWILRTGRILTPLYDEMLKEIKKSGNAFIDETPVRLQVKGKGKLQQGYMWILVGGEGSDPPNRVYRFFPDRKHENAVALLDGFTGSLHSDKYGAYEKYALRPSIIWHPCWSHVRRKFVDAEFGDLQFRDWVLEEMQKLFLLEREAWEADATERLRIRREQEEPLIDGLIAAVKAKVEDGSILPKSKYREALNYFYSLVPYLKNYLTAPNARMDNNVAERGIRPLAIGRKNWLFVGSHDGGQSTAVLLSLVQTCRGIGVNPREYLEDVMRRFQDHPVSRLHELLPSNWTPIK